MDGGGAVPALEQHSTGVRGDLKGLHLCAPRAGLSLRGEDARVTNSDEFGRAPIGMSDLCAMKIAGREGEGEMRTILVMRQLTSVLDNLLGT